MEHAKSGLHLSLLPHFPPREAWKMYVFELPAAWRGQPVRIVGTNQTRGSGWWTAFSQPVPPPRPSTADAFAVLGFTGLHLALFGLPALAACTLAVRRDVRGDTMLVAVGLLSIAAVGYVCFWLYFVWPPLGRAAAIVCVVASATISTWNLSRASSHDVRARITRLGRPAALTASAAVFVVCLGFLYGGWDTPLTTAGQRFSMQLPWDNGLPFFFAEGLDHGQVPHPMAGDWLSSDRPPLQTGIVLAHYPLSGHSKEVHYQIASVILQCLWILPMWALLGDLAIGPGAMALVFSAAIFSGFNAVNSFFVWPKLLPVAFLIALAGLLIGPQFPMSMRRPVLTGGVAGLLVAAAMLSHGGSIFALIGFAVTMILMRRIPCRRFFIAAFLAGVATYGPWMAYQRFVDPPGDRLLKWHLAGVINVDARSLGQTLHDSYDALTPTAIAEHKMANVKVVFGDPVLYFGSVWRMLSGYVAGALSDDGVAATDAAARVRDQTFFNFFPNLGMLTAGLIALAIPVRDPYRKAAAWLWGCIGITLLTWCLMIFGPGTTVIHAGSYFPVLLAFVACTLALYALAPLLASVVVAANIGVNFIAWVSWMRLSLRTGPLTEGALQTVPAMGCALSSVAIVALAWWAGTTRSKDNELEPSHAVAVPSAEAVARESRARGGNVGRGLEKRNRNHRR